MSPPSEALQLAVRYYQAGQFQQAEQINRTLLASDPNNADAHHLLGLLAMAQGQPAAAVGHLRAAIERQPASAEFHHHLGTACYHAGDKNQAIDSLRESVRIEPRPGSYLDLGNVLNESQQPDAAEACYREALRLDPQSALALNNLAIVLERQQRLDEALAIFAEALRLQPRSPEVLFNLGNCYSTQGKLAEAAAAYRQALNLKPDFAVAYYNMGALLYRQQKYAEAAAYHRDAIRYKPDFADAHRALGTALQALGYLPEAETAFRRVLALQPDLPVAVSGLGYVLHRQQRFAEAVECHRQIVRANGDDIEALTALAVALVGAGQKDEARSCFDRAIKLESSDGMALLILGSALQMHGRPVDARTVYRRCDSLLDDNAPALSSLAQCVQVLGEFPWALATYEKALTLAPDSAEIHCYRATAWLALGDFENGFREWEWRLMTQHVYRGRPEPLWQGSDLRGHRILLHTEGGLGDTLQFLRYAPLVARRGGDVVIEVQPELIPLLERAGIKPLVARGEAPQPRAQWRAPLLSLPRIFATTLDTIPAEVPYLWADAARVAQWRDRLLAYPGCKIGIHWQASDSQQDDEPPLLLAEFERLARVAGVTLISLQKGAGVEQLAAIGDRFTVVDFGGELDADGAFLDTAAIMTQLDLVITDDSALAHLAGALGARVWVPLAYACEWRWLRERPDSPWYPTMRLFRQSQLDDWPALFARIAVELGQLVETTRRQS